jgi:hypothetical protein
LQAKVKRGYIAATALVAVIGLAMLSMVSPVVSTTEDFSIFNTGWNGTSGLAVATYETGNFAPSFRVDASGTDVTVAELGFEELGLDPATDAVAVIGPSAPFTAADGQVMGAFVRGGGVLLLADDFGTGNSLLSSMGAQSRFSGELVLDLSFDKRPEFPVCYDLRVDPLMVNVTTLQLNHASSIVPGAGITGIAYSSAASWLDSNGNAMYDVDEPMGPFPLIARETLGAGTIVLLADPSVLINGMTDYMDNARFSDNLVSYLCSARSAMFFDESHRTFFDPVTVTTELTGAVPDTVKAAVIVVAAVLALWLVTDVIDRAVDLAVRAFRTLAARVMRLITRKEREKPAPHERSVDELVDELKKAHPDWREGLIRYVLTERNRHGQFLSKHLR